MSPTRIQNVAKPDLPRGIVLTTSFLKKKGLTKQLLTYYQKTNWLNKIASGAYIMQKDEVDWLGGIYALQYQLGKDIHVGGRTALELQGYAHYITKTLRLAVLWAPQGVTLPRWYLKRNWEKKILFKATNLFGVDVISGFTQHSHKSFTVRISSPERAALEMVSMVPDAQGFDEAARIMESLMTLRPDVVQTLLQDCRSVKAKRLFLYMAEWAGHEWLVDLNMEKLDIGSGKRQIVAGGVLDRKFGITVPREFAR